MEPITTITATAAAGTMTSTTAAVSTAAISAEKLNVLRQLVSSMFRSGVMTTLQESELIDEFAQPIYTSIALVSNSFKGSTPSTTSADTVDKILYSNPNSPAIPNLAGKLPQPAPPIPNPRDDVPIIMPQDDRPELPRPGEASTVSREITIPFAHDREELHPVVKDMLDKYYHAPTIESQLNSGIEKVVIERDFVDQRIIDNGESSKTAICLIQERVVDRKYLNYGHLSDFIAEIRHGNIPTIRQFFLAVVDLSDAATFKILRPYLEKYKLEGAQYQLRQFSLDLQRKTMPSKLTAQTSQDFGIDRKTIKRSWYKTDQVIERTGHQSTGTIRGTEIVAANFKELLSVEMSKQEIDNLLTTKKQFSDLLGADHVIRLESSLSTEQIADTNRNALVWIRENVVTTTKDWTTDETFHRYWTDLKKNLGTKVEVSDTQVKQYLQSNFSEFFANDENIDIEKFDTYAQAFEKFQKLEKTAALSTDKMLIDEYEMASANTEFRDGWITYVPGGSVANLGLKADLGCKVTAMDWVWAGVDVALIAAAVVTLGTSAAATASAKTATTAVAAAGKTALTTGGKIVVQNGTKAGSKAGFKALSRSGVKANIQTGSKTLGKAGPKAGFKALDKSGSKALVRGGAKPGTQLGTKTVGELTENSAKVATKTGFTPNSTQIIDGFKYVTDNEGRVIKATGKLKLDKGTRVTTNQTKAANWGKAGDQGGHLIPANYGGPGELINHVPQAEKVNQSVVKRIENEMGRALKQGKNVEYTVCPHYPVSGELRPEKFTIRYSIDGVQKIRRIANG